jgi:hypothetical protein
VRFLFCLWSGSVSLDNLSSQSLEVEVICQHIVICHIIGLFGFRIHNHGSQFTATSLFHSFLRIHLSSMREIRDQRWGEIWHFLLYSFCFHDPLLQFPYYGYEDETNDLSGTDGFDEYDYGDPWTEYFPPRERKTL